MPLNILVFYGSYRRDRMGIRLADYIVNGFAKLGHAPALIDAKAIDLPMLDRRHRDYAPGEAPENMARLADRIRAADAFVFVAGEYNWGMQPGLKNLTDHYLEEWARRPAAIASYSGGRLGGARSNSMWHPTLTEMGLVVVPATLTVATIDKTLDENAQPLGDGGAALERGFQGFADTLVWWAKAAKAQSAVSR
jgi:NAD(P)H-dependent FMN reductase